MKKLLTILFAVAFGLNLSAQVPDYVPSDGLVAWYEFNASPNDESNSNFNLCAASLTYTSDRWGATEGAYLSTYGGDLLSACDPSGIWSNSISYSLWFNPYDLTSDPYPSGWFALVTMNGWNGEAFGTIISTYGSALCSAEQLRIRPNWPSNQTFATCEEIQEDQWYHLCVTGNEDSTNVFLNGDLIATSLHASEANFANVPFEWTIGASATNHTYHFKGAIDDVGIWNRALSEEEILALYNAEPPISDCTDPTACNYNEEATSDDGSCIPSGCMEAEACNYNALAECEGEACDYSCCPGPGCCGEGTNWNPLEQTCESIPCETILDPLACGPGTFWDETASQCLPILTCQEDLDGDGVIGINDLMELLSSFGTMCEEPETSEFNCGDMVNYHGYDYATVQIGEQCWFAENLRTELYRNGDAIAGQLTVADWTTTEEGASAVYGESDDCVNHSPLIDACDSAQALIEYGRLYNGYAVIDSRGLCPVDWSIPNNSSWQLLITLAGGVTVAGGFLKADTGWSGSGSGINSFGFAGKPGGDRNINGDFVESGHDGDWWTSSSNGTSVLVWEMYHLNSSINQLNGPLTSGFSVRCIKDSE